MKFKVFLAVAGTLMILNSGAVYAQTAVPTDKPAAAESQPRSKSKAKATSKAKKPKAERSAKSMECSKQADEKSLHGKARQKFRAKCMKG
jgi:hypothetical protein